MKKLGIKFKSHNCFWSAFGGINKLTTILFWKFKLPPKNQTHVIFHFIERILISSKV